ncbi:MAG: T9SS type A sorting domain-containing protein, partial [Chlorobi bacterium]|nr:T9SS type A sorting domain-containing protein [Chlorobiota bacterium]
SYRTASAGTWSATTGEGTATWEQFDGSSWNPIDDEPPVNTDNNVYIRHQITLVGNNSARNLIIENGGTILTNGVPVTLTNLLVKDGGTYHKQSNSLAVNDGGVIEVESGGTFIFEHTNSTSLSTNIWNGTEKFHRGSYFVIKKTDNVSNFLVIETNDDVDEFDGGCFGYVVVDFADGGKLQLLPDGFNKTLAKDDLIFRSSADNVRFGQGTFAATVLGDLIIENTYAHSLTVLQNNGSADIRVNGDFVKHNSADFRIQNSNTSNTADATLHIGGNMVINNGNFKFDIGSSTDATFTLNLEGNLAVASGALLANDNPAVKGVLNFSGSGQVQTVDIATDGFADENSRIDFIIQNGASVRMVNGDWELGKNSLVRVEAGGKLNFGFNGNTALKITKSGTQTGTAFDLDAGGYLYITSPDGIWSDSSVGNVQVVASNTTFSPLATFHYIGKENQITGDAIGSSSNGRAVIVELENNSLTLTPTQSFGITDATNPYINNGNGGILDIRKGQFVETNSAYITGSTGGLRMADGTRYVIASNSADASDYLPRLQGLGGAYDLQGSSVIELAGDGNKILRGSRAYRHLTFSNAGTTTLSSAVTSITGEVYITDNATLDVENRTFGGDNTDLRMDANAVYRTAGTGTKPDARGVYNLSDNSKVVFTNTSPSDWQLIRLNRTFKHIVIEGTNVGNASTGTGIGLHPGGSFTVENGGVFKLKNTAGLTGNPGGAVDTSTDPTVDLRTGSMVEYAGADQIITNDPYYKLAVSGTGTKTLGDTLITVTDDVEIKSSVLLIEDDKTLSVGGDVINPGGTVEINHAGSLVQTDPNAVVSDGRYILHKKAENLAHFYDYVFWSAPVHSSVYTFDDLVSGAWARYAFDARSQVAVQNPNPGWVPVNGSDTLTPGRGYAVSAPRTFTGGPLEVTFEVNGEAFNTGDISVPVYINGIGAQDDDDYNLVGNPYPSAVDFDALYADNSSVIEGRYYAWTNCAGLDASGRHQAAGYASYAVGSGGTQACGSTGLQAGRYINTAQGIFVEANADGTLLFQNAHRVAGHNNQFLNRPSGGGRVWVNLTAADGSVFRQILVAFVPGATPEKDSRFDAPVMYAPAANFYSIGGGVRYAVQGLPEWDGGVRHIPLGITTQQGGIYRLSLDSLQGDLVGADIYIRDLAVGTWHDLGAEDFEVQLQPGTFEDRFELVIAPRTAAVDDDNYGIRIARSADEFRIYGNTGLEGAALFDLTGRLWIQARAGTGGIIVLPAQNLPSGVYLIRLRWSDGHESTVKVIR